MGAKAVNKIDNNLKEKLISTVGDYVEIGGENGDGSTMLLHAINNNEDKNSKFFSIDPAWGEAWGGRIRVGNDGIPANDISQHTQTFNELKSVENTFLEKTTGESFLESEFEKKSESKKIKFMYLDGFDFAYPEAEHPDANYDKKSMTFSNPENLSDYMKKQIDGYKRMGFDTLNNFNSIKSHMNCAELFLKFCSDYCLILMDDTYYDYDGDFQGKCAQAIPFLLQNGFKIIKSGTTKEHGYENPQEFRNSFLEEIQPNAYFLLEKND